MPTTNITYPFKIQGRYAPLVAGPVKEKWTAAAKQKGYVVLGLGGEERQFVVLGCTRCGEPLLRRSSVIEGKGDIHCRSCIRKPYDIAAAKFGATIIGKDPNGGRHDRILKLACGHVKKLQRGRILKVARGTGNVDCYPCRLERYDVEAKAYGWTFLSELESRQGYALYRHDCGVVQEISIGNMKVGQCSCRQCGDQEKPGQPGIYVFQIDLPNLSVLKLGYSKRHVHRLRRDLRIAKSVPTEIIRFLPLPDRPLAISEERKAHRYLHKHHPHLVVPKAEFGDAIFVKSEIYRTNALPQIQRLLDEIARQHAAPLS